MLLKAWVSDKYRKIRHAARAYMVKARLPEPKRLGFTRPGGNVFETTFM